MAIRKSALGEAPLPWGKTLPWIRVHLDTSTSAIRFGVWSLEFHLQAVRSASHTEPRKRGTPNSGSDKMRPVDYQELIRASFLHGFPTL
jgi:hypothetical protein